MKTKLNAWTGLTERIDERLNDAAKPAPTLAETVAVKMGLEIFTQPLALSGAASMDRSLGPSVRSASPAVDDGIAMMLRHHDGSNGGSICGSGSGPTRHASLQIAPAPSLAFMQAGAAVDLQEVAQRMDHVRQSLAMLLPEPTAGAPADTPLQAGARQALAQLTDLHADLVPSVPSLGLSAGSFMRGGHGMPLPAITEQMAMEESADHADVHIPRSTQQRRPALKTRIAHDATFLNSDGPFQRIPDDIEDEQVIASPVPGPGAIADFESFVVDAITAHNTGFPPLGLDAPDASPRAAPDTSKAAGQLQAAKTASGPGYADTAAAIAQRAVGKSPAKALTASQPALCNVEDDVVMGMQEDLQDLVMQASPVHPARTAAPMVAFPVSKEGTAAGSRGVQSSAALAAASMMDSVELPRLLSDDDNRVSGACKACREYSRF